jgi:Uma2 family endonuclease
MTLRPVTHKFTVSDYYKMAKEGILSPDDRVELIEGEIVEMTPIGSRHFAAVNRLNRALVREVGDRGIVSIQNPVFLSDRSMPQPDLVLLAPSQDDYESGIPGPDKAFLVAEVADSSLQYDTLTKIPLYAQSGVPEVWLVDLVLNRIEVYRKPSEGVFTDQQTFERGQSLSPLAFPDIVISVEEVIG